MDPMDRKIRYIGKTAKEQQMAVVRKAQFNINTELRLYRQQFNAVMDVIDLPKLYEVYGAMMIGSDKLIIHEPLMVELQRRYYEATGKEVSLDGLRKVLMNERKAGRLPTVTGRATSGRFF